MIPYSILPNYNFASLCSSSQLQTDNVKTQTLPILPYPPPFPNNSTHRDHTQADKLRPSSPTNDTSPKPGASCSTNADKSQTNAYASLSPNAAFASASDFKAGASETESVSEPQASGN